MLEHWDLFAKAPGAKDKHHTWPGGYLDHLIQVNNLIALNTNYMISSGAMNSLPIDEQFSAEQAILIGSVHDLEKPFRYCRPGTINPKLITKQQRERFKYLAIGQIGLVLDHNQQNALRFAEGLRDSDYSASERIMRPMAGVVHAADMISASACYNRSGIFASATQPQTFEAYSKV